MSGKNLQQFTLPLMEMKSTSIAGYVHAISTPKKKEMAIVHAMAISFFLGV
eukprot:Skav214775  [mRNA]  locus=scaffold5578:11427:11579:- [translate_table: standard]